jgi:hypothetical protein
MSYRMTPAVRPAQACLKHVREPTRRINKKAAPRTARDRLLRAPPGQRVLTSGLRPVGRRSRSSVPRCGARESGGCSYRPARGVRLSASVEWASRRECPSAP